MKTVNVVVGAPEWHSHRASSFNASDSPAMLGVSPYKTRSELLRELFTGVAQEVDANTQARFDDGHHWEALARPLAESIIGEDLYAVVGVKQKLSASFDGLTIDESIIWEHKSLNDSIRAAGCARELPECLRAQMEHQLHVSDASRCLFMASKWDDSDELIEEIHHWYEPDHALRNRIIAGWVQFEMDLADYVPVEIVPAGVAAPIKDLPAIRYQLNGLSLTSNLADYKAAALQLVEDSKAELVTDQDFSDRDSLCKKFKKAEEGIAILQGQVISEIKDVDSFNRDLEEIAGLIRQARLAGEKKVAAEKENRRNEIIAGAKGRWVDHIARLNARIGKFYMPDITTNFAGVMKGLKSLDSMKNAVDTELARAKIEANAIADKIDINLSSLRALAKDHAFLFADTSQIALKANDDLIALIKSRIADHAAAEARKAEILRAQIAEEERAKAEAKYKSELEAKAAGEEAERVRVATAAATEENRSDPVMQEFFGDLIGIPAHPAPIVRAPAENTAPKRPVAVEMVTIQKSEYDRLLRDSDWLECMNQAGVDNWDGIENAREFQRKEVA